MTAMILKLNRKEQIYGGVILGLLVLLLCNFTSYLNLKTEAAENKSSYMTSMIKLNSEVKIKETKIVALNIKIKTLTEDLDTANNNLTEAKANIDSLNYNMNKLNTILKTNYKNQNSYTMPYKKLTDFYQISKDDLNTWIASKAPNNSPFIGRADAFLEASNKTNIDPVYIVAHAAIESAWGTSSQARYKGNYFGIGSFNANPSNAYTLINRGGNSLQDKFKEGIINGANWIKSNYIDQGQDTVYSMAFGNKHYCVKNDGSPDDDWVKQITNLMVSSNINN